MNSSARRPQGWESFLREKVRDQEQELSDAATYEATLEQRLQDLQSETEMLRASLDRCQRKYNRMTERVSKLGFERERLQNEVEQLKATLKRV
jgi:peptidoglycan hydrolase CwlO-like protein